MKILYTIVHTQKMGKKLVRLVFKKSRFFLSIVGILYCLLTFFEDLNINKIQKSMFKKSLFVLGNFTYDLWFL